MRTLAYITSVLAFFSTVAVLTSFQGEGQGPKLTLEWDVQEREIIEGGDGTFYFPYQNTGDSPLIVSLCKSSCGCLVPKCGREPLNPGDRDTLWGKYLTRRVGIINKSMTMTSNDAQVRHIVKIKGHVYPDSVEKAIIEFDKKEINVGQLCKGSHPEFAFHFKSRGNIPLVIQIVKGNSGSIVPHWPKKEFEPGESETIGGQFSANRIGPFVRHLTVRTTASKDPFRLTIKGTVVDCSK